MKSLKSDEQISKFLSLILRHQPDKIGLALDDSGWADVDELIERSDVAGVCLDRSILEHLVATSDKQRFTLSPDGNRIRANQGHSIAVNLDLPPQVPPAQLYHGTATRFLKSIRQEGLRSMSRQHVHLSHDERTARKVGQRHGVPAILRINAKLMHEAGHVFFLSDNGVWLTETVPTRFITFASS